MNVRSMAKYTKSAFRWKCFYKHNPLEIILLFEILPLFFNLSSSVWGRAKKKKILRVMGGKASKSLKKYKGIKKWPLATAFPLIDVFWVFAILFEHLKCIKCCQKPLSTQNRKHKATALVRISYMDVFVLLPFFFCRLM